MTISRNHTYMYICLMYIDYTHINTVVQCYIQHIHDAIGDVERKKERKKDT